MEAKLLSQDKEKRKLSFVLKDSNAFLANTLRRMIIEEVPTLVINEEVHVGYRNYPFIIKELGFID